MNDTLTQNQVKRKFYAVARTGGGFEVARARAAASARSSGVMCAALGQASRPSVLAPITTACSRAAMASSRDGWCLSQKSHFARLNPRSVEMGMARSRISSTVCWYTGHEGRPSPFGFPVDASVRLKGGKKKTQKKTKKTLEHLETLAKAKKPRSPDKTRRKNTQ
jgi:hypothetical protein